LDEEDRASNASQDTTVTSSRYTSITHTSDDHGRAEVPGQTGSQVLDQYRCFVRFFLSGERITWTLSSPHSQRESPFRWLFLELSGYFLNALRPHVNAADVLVRRSMDMDSSDNRYVRHPAG
jgi:hypothetical protein